MFEIASEFLRFDSTSSLLSYCSLISDVFYWRYYRQQNCFYTISRNSAKFSTCVSAFIYMQLEFHSVANCVLHRTDCNMLKVPVLIVLAY